MISSKLWHELADYANLRLLAKIRRTKNVRATDKLRGIFTKVYGYNRFNRKLYFVKPKPKKHNKLKLLVAESFFTL